MRSGPISLQLDPHCPRCDRALAVAKSGSRAGVGLLLACPEQYCDYTWTPTQSELARLMQLTPPPASGPRRDADITRAAG